jgi:hypothetical protein
VNQIMKDAFLILAIPLACASLPVAAQEPVSGPVAIVMGSIEAAQECTLYEGVRYSNKSRAKGSSTAYAAGAGSGYAGPGGSGGSAAFAAGASSSYSASSETSFETFFIKDCQSDFGGVRQALEAALASSGAITIAKKGYRLSARVENAVPVTQGFVDTSLTGKGYGTASEGLKVTMSLKLTDANGRSIFGSLVDAQIETGSASIVRGTVAASVSDGEAVYTFLQRELAMVAARKLAFHFKPLQVTGAQGKKVKLNYGGPLLEVGTLLAVTSPDGFSSSRYRVTSVAAGSAIATQLGDANVSSITAGSSALVIEKGDPAANESNLEFVPLP